MLLCILTTKVYTVTARRRKHDCEQREAILLDHVPTLQMLAKSRSKTCDQFSARWLGDLHQDASDRNGRLWCACLARSHTRAVQICSWRHPSFARRWVHTSAATSSMAVASAASVLPGFQQRSGSRQDNGTGLNGVGRLCCRGVRSADAEWLVHQTTSAAGNGSEHRNKIRPHAFALSLMLSRLL